MVIVIPNPATAPAVSKSSSNKETTASVITRTQLITLSISMSLSSSYSIQDSGAVKPNSTWETQIETETRLQNITLDETKTEIRPDFEIILRSRLLIIFKRKQGRHEIEMRHRVSYTSVLRQRLSPISDWTIGMVLPSLYYLSIIALYCTILEQFS